MRGVPFGGNHKKATTGLFLAAWPSARLRAYRDSGEQACKFAPSHAFSDGLGTGIA